MERMLYDGERALCAAQLEREGPCLHLQLRVPELLPGVCRVWGCWEDGFALFGIPTPEGGGMYLERRIPASSLPEGMPQRLVLEKSGALRPWSGAVDDAFIRHGAALAREGGMTLYLPFCEDRPFALLPLFRLCRLAPMLGQTCIALELDVRGQPMRTDSPTGQWSEPNTSE